MTAPAGGRLPSRAAPTLRHTMDRGLGPDGPTPASCRLPSPGAWPRGGIGLYPGEVARWDTAPRNRPAHPVTW